MVVAAGSLRDDADDVVVFPHRWTPGGVSVRVPFTGAHLLHLAVAGCVLNDVYREAQRLDVPLAGVRVRTAGGFEPTTWTSTGIRCTVDLDPPATTNQQAAVLEVVEAVAEIPKALGAGAAVTRTAG